MNKHEIDLDELKRRAESERERLSLELAYELGKGAGIEEAEKKVREIIRNINNR